MAAEVGIISESDEAQLKLRIDRDAYALFLGEPAKGGASEIVRMISRRADHSARRKLELAWERARARKAR